MTANKIETTYFDHFFRVVDNLLTRFLDFGNGDVTREGRVNVRDHRRKRWLVFNTGRRVDNIGADNDGRVLAISEEGNGFGVWDGIDPPELDIDSERKGEPRVVG